VGVPHRRQQAMGTQPPRRHSGRGQCSVSLDFIGLVVDDGDAAAFGGCEEPHLWRHAVFTPPPSLPPTPTLSHQPINTYVCCWVIDCYRLLVEIIVIAHAMIPIIIISQRHYTNSDRVISRRLSYVRPEETNICITLDSLAVSPGLTHSCYPHWLVLIDLYNRVTLGPRIINYEYIAGLDIYDSFFAT
jgi:hypothetical protein